LFNPLPNKNDILRVIADNLRDHLGKKEKLLKLSNFSFYHNDFYPTRALFLYFVSILFVVCKLFQFGLVQDLSFGKGLTVQAEAFKSFPRFIKV